MAVLRRALPEQFTPYRAARMRAGSGLFALNSLISDIDNLLAHCAVTDVLCYNVEAETSIVLTLRHFEAPNSK